mgnify:CR=1 FL=1
MSKNVLTDKDLEKLAKLGVRIRACLWNRNDTGVPCRTDRLEAVRLMQEYLTIHDIQINEAGPSSSTLESF